MTGKLYYYIVDGPKHTLIDMKDAIFNLDVLKASLKAGGCFIVGVGAAAAAPIQDLAEWYNRSKND